MLFWISIDDLELRLDLVMFVFKDELPQSWLALSSFDILDDYASDLVLSCHINQCLLPQILASRHYWDWISLAALWS